MLPLHGLQRLEKIMDEYVGGISAYYTTNEPLLIRGLELLCMLKEDLAYLGAEDTENCVAADALLAASTDLVRLLEGIADELMHLPAAAWRAMAPPSRSERQTCMQDKAHRGSVGPIW